MSYREKNIFLNRVKLCQSRFVYSFILLITFFCEYTSFDDVFNSYNCFIIYHQHFNNVLSIMIARARWGHKLSTHLHLQTLFSNRNKMFSKIIPFSFHLKMFFKTLSKDSNVNHPKVQILKLIIYISKSNETMIF